MVWFATCLKFLKLGPVPAQEKCRLKNSLWSLTALWIWESFCWLMAGLDSFTGEPAHLPLFLVSDRRAIHLRLCCSSPYCFLHLWSCIGHFPTIHVIPLLSFQHVLKRIIFVKVLLFSRALLIFIFKLLSK